MIDPACETVRTSLHELVSGRLAAERRRAVEEHLEKCAKCRAVLDEERVVTRLLEEKLPRDPASAGLRDRLKARIEEHPDDSKVRPSVRRWPSRVTPFLAMAALALSAIVLVFIRNGRFDGGTALRNEAVNDHLRVLYAERPVEIESGGIHQVKPWFSGRVDFAPPITFSGDDEFPLVGGAVAFFVDRKAAEFVFKRRLHTISVFVFRATGLDLPKADEERLRGGRVGANTERGFHVVMFQAGDLGYALVSDVDPAELMRLAGKLGVLD